jgi:hypothetical protein
MGREGGRIFFRFSPSRVGELREHTQTAQQWRTPGEMGRNEKPGIDPEGRTLFSKLSSKLDDNAVEERRMNTRLA